MWILSSNFITTSFFMIVLVRVWNCVLCLTSQVLLLVGVVSRCTWDNLIIMTSLEWCRSLLACCLPWSGLTHRWSYLTLRPSYVSHFCFTIVLTVMVYLDFYLFIFLVTCVFYNQIVENPSISDFMSSDILSAVPSMLLSNIINLQVIVLKIVSRIFACYCFVFNTWNICNECKISISQVVKVIGEYVNGNRCY